MRQWRFAAVVVACAVMIGCASKTGTQRQNVRSSSPDLITTAEIEATPASNAFDLVNRLRPRWLQSGSGRVASISGRSGGNSQGQVLLVYLDDTRLGSVESLRSLSINGFRSLRYYDAVRATTLLRNTGNQPISGAIVISTKDK
ncbi:MAG TPA: hypothetical protein VEA99_20820 [Gemmatimonadaceae bacterium]|nr:hypothetical protein [Gemmatimonadaceae bacterium]